MTKLNHITLLAGAALLGALLTVAPARAAENKWPGTKAGEPTPKPKAVPAVLAKNLANFDDLDFRVYPASNGRTFTRATPRTSSCTGPTATRPRASRSISRI